ncbi:MAG: DgaE family pyridoxal phosphate-dependent ammonia lyase [Culicoidibacterales bacterium]
MIAKINVRKVVNASGRMTILGVSTPSQTVLERMNFGAGSYVVMDELLAEASAKIASLIGVEGACIVANASSGLVLTIASLICAENRALIEKFHDYCGSNRFNVVMLKGHNINYGVPIDLVLKTAHVAIKEAGHSNLSYGYQVDALIDDATKALIYVQSHHAVQKNMVSLEELVSIGQQRKIPVIVDAAAEEDLQKYLKIGADFVVYSGTKAICGPTSGLVLTKTKQAALELQAQYHGIGRIMKVGKETIYGLVQAVSEYVQSKPKQLITTSELDQFVQQVELIPGLSAKMTADEAGRNIFRVTIKVDALVYGCDAKDLSQRLKSYPTAIYTRDYQASKGKLCIDPRPLLAGDLACIIQALRTLQGVKK